MKHQALFSSKDKNKKLKCRLLQFLFGALRVKCFNILWILVRTALYAVCSKMCIMHIKF